MGKRSPHFFLRTMKHFLCLAVLLAAVSAASAQITPVNCTTVPSGVRTSFISLETISKAWSVSGKDVNGETDEPNDSGTREKGL